MEGLWRRDPLRCEVRVHPVPRGRIAPVNVGCMRACSMASFPFLPCRRQGLEPAPHAVHLHGMDVSGPPVQSPSQVGRAHRAAIVLQSLLLASIPSHGTSPSVPCIVVAFRLPCACDLHEHVSSCASAGSTVDDPLLLGTRRADRRRCDAPRTWRRCDVCWCDACRMDATRDARWRRR